MSKVSREAPGLGPHTQQSRVEPQGLSSSKPRFSNNSSPSTSSPFLRILTVPTPADY